MCGPDAEDSDHLPPPEVIVQEIVEDLQVALNEFAALAETLEAEGRSAGGDDVKA